MTFAEALARIEYLGHQAHHDNAAGDERDFLLFKYADSIVQLRKVAAEMRNTFDIVGDTTEVNHKALARKGSAYDALMKEGE